MQKQIRIAVLATNDIEDMEFMIPIDIWKRAKIIVDVVSCEIKNTFSLNYSGLKVSAPFNIKSTNLSQYDAIFLPGGMGCKNFINPAVHNKDEGESKLHLSIKKFFSDSSKWLLSICASPVAILCILGIKPENAFKFTSFNNPELIGDYLPYWVDKKVVIEDKMISAQSAGCSIDLALVTIESLISLEAAQEVAKSIQIDYKGYKSYQ